MFFELLPIVHLDESLAVSPRSAEKRANFLRNHRRRHRKRTTPLEVRQATAKIRRTSLLRSKRARCHFHVTAARANVYRRRMKAFQEANLYRESLDQKQEAARERREQIQSERMRVLQSKLAKVENAEFLAMRTDLDLPMPKSQTRAQRKQFERRFEEEQRPVAWTIPVHSDEEEVADICFPLTSRESLITRAQIEHRLSYAQSWRDLQAREKRRSLQTQSCRAALVRSRARYTDLCRREGLRFRLAFRMRNARSRRESRSALKMARLQSRNIHVETVLSDYRIRQLRTEVENSFPSVESRKPQVWALAFTPGVTTWDQMAPGKTSTLSNYFSRYKRSSPVSIARKHALGDERYRSLIREKVRKAERTRLRVLRVRMQQECQRIQKMNRLQSRLSSAHHRRFIMMMDRRRLARQHVSHARYLARIKRKNLEDMRANANEPFRC